MDKPYKRLLWLSIITTVILFLIDEDEWDLSYQSIIGYVVVGILYFISIFFLSSAMYWVVAKVGGIIKIRWKRTNG
ncbi:hypothetical protein [Polluticoccus soli]|uniref:hypothetical protein n=1 Tax=Polluticoccus soli TaxID=3034150 RepID=UPI0023E10424|nr:hypothetical protein [Flavipsychrobacter sp. JY13-12]